MVVRRCLLAAAGVVAFIYVCAFTIGFACLAAALLAVVAARVAGVSFVDVDRESRQRLTDDELAEFLRG